MTRTDSWRLKLFMATTTTVLTLLVLAVVGEVAVRYRERHRETIPGVMPFLYYRHQRLGHALVRDFDYFGWVHINPQGFRGRRPVALDKPDGVLRIMAVGGSTTFDTFVSGDTAAWPARLEHWLQRLAPDRKVEVINAGVPGYAVMQDLIRLETELYAYRPDLIVLYQGHNDLFGNLKVSAGLTGSTGSRPEEAARVTPWTAWLERHSLLYAKLAERFKLKRFARLRSRTAPAAGGARADGGAPPDDGAARFEQVVSEYLAVAQALRLRVVIPEVVQISGDALVEKDPGRQALWQATVPFSNPETVLQGYRHYNLILTRLSSQYAAPFLPMMDLGIAGPEYYSPEDPIHFNDRGADRFAEGLARRLLAAGLLSPTGP
jgi:lysophospholipase L1-like esterase